MAYNDPVLQRSMFQKQAQPSVAPAVGLGGGLGSMSSPDENAKQLRSMFAPTVDINRPAQAIQEPQPIQYFQEGGFAQPVPIDEVESQYVKQLPPPTSQFRRDLSRFMEGVSKPMPSFDPNATDAATQRVMRDREEILRRRGNIEAAGRTFEELRQTPAPPSYLEPMPESTYRQRMEESFAPLREAQQAALARQVTIPVVPGGVGSLSVARMLDRDRADENPLALTKPAEKKEPSIKTNLDEIKAERQATAAERSAAERRENALLALMQAGFAMAAGRSPNAISNIGAGGQAGIAAFASMEKARREDESMRRREQLQLDIAKMQLERDPETVRTYAILGGWTPQMGREGYQEAVRKGFQFLQSKEAPKQALDLLKLSQTDPTLLTAEQRKLYTDIVTGSLSTSLGRGGGFPGFSGTAVSSPTR